MNEDTSEQPAGPALAQVALVLSCIGIVFFPAGFGGALLGILALRNGGPRLKSFGAITLGLLGLTVGVAIVGGDVLRFKVRAKQAECKTHLVEAIAAERAFLAKSGSFSPNPKAIGFTVKLAPHDLLLFSADGPIAARYDQVGDADVGVPNDPWHYELKSAELRTMIPSAVLSEVGVHGSCPADCWITVVCAGQIDHDPTIDVWTISTHERQIGGKTVPADEPFNDVDDVWQ